MLYRGQLLFGAYRGKDRILQRISVGYGPGYALALQSWC